MLRIRGSTAAEFVAVAGRDPDRAAAYAAQVGGTEGKITIPDPWLCRYGFVELERGGMTERLPADPGGEYGLSTDPDNDDAYRIEFETASRLIEGGATAVFGRADAVDQAAAIEAVRAAAVAGDTITLAAPRLRW